MSAWDVTGAVVSAALLFMFMGLCRGTVGELARQPGLSPTGSQTAAFALILPTLCWLTFCVARLFGAHA